jgi:hypothetical protein
MEPMEGSLKEEAEEESLSFFVKKFMVREGGEEEVGLECEEGSKGVGCGAREEGGAVGGAVCV